LDENTIHKQTIHNSKQNFIKNIFRMSSDAKKEADLLKTDIYGILGVQKDASDGEIKKAYRKLALKLHPDKCQDKDAPERFHKLQEAYDFIMEPANRAKFNMHLENAQKQEMRKQAMDSVLRKKRDDLARREKESVDSGMMAERKKASRKG